MNKKLKIAFGCDHVAVSLKKNLIEFVQEMGHEVLDIGTHSNSSVDYPIYGYHVATKVVNNEVDFGILICGTGVGISLAANKVKGIRAVVCSDVFTAKLSREHNNSNILALGARVVGLGVAKLIVQNFLESSFEGGRHQKRLEMLEEIEKGVFSNEQ